MGFIMFFMQGHIEIQFKERRKIIFAVTRDQIIW